jgi:hypothetical protein
MAIRRIAIPLVDRVREFAQKWSVSVASGFAMIGALSLEAARSGRSACKICGTNIAQGAGLRVCALPLAVLAFVRRQ